MQDCSCWWYPPQRIFPLCVLEERADLKRISEGTIFTYSQTLEYSGTEHSRIGFSGATSDTRNFSFMLAIDTLLKIELF